MRKAAHPKSVPFHDPLPLGPYAWQAVQEGSRIAVASIRGAWALPKGTRARRLLWLAGVLPLSAIQLITNWLCLWLDDLLFPGARSVEIRNPVFVLGPPRCGTTFLHRVLAADSGHFCTSPTWEVFLAPSVLQKKVIRALLRLDRRLGSPLRAGVRRIERKLSGGFDTTHPGSLSDPEEDYFYLLSIGVCTGVALAFPDGGGFRRLVPGLPEDAPADRKRALEFHRFCLRKQLYVDGRGRTLLSKNASFSSWMDVLPGVYPDAQWIACMRDPAEAVPSMLSTADAAMRDFHLGGLAKEAGRWLMSAMRAHYRVTAEAAERLGPSRFQVVSQTDLKDRLEAVMDALTATFGWQPDEEARTGWRQRAEVSRGHRSSHRYRSETYGLDSNEIRDTFPVTSTTVPDGIGEDAA